MNAITIRIAAVTLAGLALCAGSRAATTVNATNRYAYGANIGWIDFRGDVTNGAAFGQLYCTGYVWSANAGWINLGKRPTNGVQYSNTSADDFGVNVVGNNLRGYAYGANIGWINFETNGNPQVDLLTGNLSGHAYGANVGWISLSNLFAYVETDTLATGQDKDGDGIPDAWELTYATNLTTLGSAPADADNDGIPDLDEYIADTDPQDGTSFLAITDIEHVSPTSLVSWSVSPSRVYRLEQGVDPTNNATWTDSGLGLIAPGADPVLTKGVNDPAATSRTFRAKAQLPLAP